MKSHSVITSHINAANSFLQISFPVLYSPLLVSIEKTSISSIRNTEEYAQWKLVNPDIDHSSCLDIAIARIIKSPTYFAKLFFTAKFELPQIDLNGNNKPKLPASYPQELTSRIVVLKSNHVWFADFSKALTAICQNHADSRL
jgi:hypothetical protein